MSCRYRAGLRKDIQQVFLDGWSYGGFEGLWRDQIHLAPEQVLQVEFQTDVVRPGRFVELYQDVNIAALS